jgi:hypothetical protein
MDLLRISNSKVLYILVLFFATLGGEIAYAQIGPDAYRPIIVIRNVNGQMQQTKRRPTVPYEGYKDYQFDSETPISEMSDVEKIVVVKPRLNHAGIFSSNKNPDVIQGLLQVESALMRTPGSKGYIVVYAAGADRRNKLTQRAFASATKDYFTKPKPYGYRFEESRFITIDGGVRDHLTIEFWKANP